MMKFGMVLPTYGVDANRLASIDTAHAAEALGFDSIWVTDHLALPEADAHLFGRIFESTATISYLAGATSKIKLGFSALVLPQRNPVEVAKVIATMDLLSSGRLILAAGVGWSQGEYFNLGKKFSDRGKRMDEAIEILRLLWSGREVVSYKGDYYSFEDLYFSPKPIQRGGPPILIAGNSKAAIVRAAKLGDGWHPTIKTPAVFSEDMKVINNLIGTRPFNTCMRVRYPLPEEFHTNRKITEVSEAFIHLIQDYQRNGLDDLVIDFTAGNQAERERMMKRFFEEIAPQLV